MHKFKSSQQRNEVGMASPLGPTIANFFLAHIENKSLSSGLNFLPKLYLCCVDDSFAVFADDRSYTKFLHLLNAQPKNIELDVGHAFETIPFLDVEIKLTSLGVDS